LFIVSPVVDDDEGALGKLRRDFCTSRVRREGESGKKTGNHKKKVVFSPARRAEDRRQKTEDRALAALAL
jgi:hypothetical protein